MSHVTVLEVNEGNENDLDTSLQASAQTPKAICDLTIFFCFYLGRTSWVSPQPIEARVGLQRVSIINEKRPAVSGFLRERGRS